MKPKDQVEIGDVVRIDNMFGEPQYNYREGIVTEINGTNQIYGSWGEYPLFFTDDWEIIGKSNSEVLDFIHRRFPKDSDWFTGNCYYFALILKDRFPEGSIFYDVIDGHFVTKIDDINYDWSGVVSNNGYHYYVEWDKFNTYDSLQKERIIRDCIL